MFDSRVLDEKIFMCEYKIRELNQAIKKLEKMFSASQENYDEAASQVNAEKKALSKLKQFDLRRENAGPVLSEKIQSLEKKASTLESRIHEIHSLLENNAAESTQSNGTTSNVTNQLKISSLEQEKKEVTDSLNMHRKEIDFCNNLLSGSPQELEGFVDSYQKKISYVTNKLELSMRNLSYAEEWKNHADKQLTDVIANRDLLTNVIASLELIREINLLIQQIPDGETNQQPGEATAIKAFRELESFSERLLSLPNNPSLRDPIKSISKQLEALRDIIASSLESIREKQSANAPAAEQPGPLS